jgi:hypothetical protein
MSRLLEANFRLNIKQYIYIFYSAVKTTWLRIPEHSLTLEWNVKYSRCMVCCWKHQATLMLRMCQLGDHLWQPRSWCAMSTTCGKAICLVGKSLFNSDAKQFFTHTQPDEIHKLWLTINITAFHCNSYTQSPQTMDYCNGHFTWNSFQMSSHSVYNC